MSKEKNFVSAVIYVHNAEKVIEDFLKVIIEVIEENFEHSEIICVNDSSTDASVLKIKEAAKKSVTTSISLLNMSYFHGLETAMNAGVNLSIGDFVFEFDCTVFDYDKSEIMNVYKMSLQGYDIVSASPDKKQKSTSNLFYYVFNKFTNLKYNMQTERFRVLSRRAINRISSMNKTVLYRKVLYANCGLKTNNIRYKTFCGFNKANDSSERKYRFSLAINSLILFTDIGYCFAKMMTIIMILSTVFMATYALIIHLAGNPVEGWATIMLSVSFLFFGLFGILTFIIKYLQIIIDLIFKRKNYNYESIEKIK